MLESLDKIDRSIFILLNGYHSASMDVVMWYISKMQMWIPVYVLLLYFLLKRFGWKGLGLAVFFVAMLLFITDFLAVHFVKSTVMRLRPSHQPDLAGQVNLVRDSFGNEYRGGKFGFFSNHASNYFGVAVFFFMLMKPMKFHFVVLLFLWVLVISYSRIYLGVHYPGDVIAGAVYGSFFGWLLGKLYLQFYNKKLAL